jgi:phage portal protein BeeE
VDAFAPLRDARWKRISEADFLTTAEKRELLGFKPLSS